MQLRGHEHTPLVSAAMTPFPYYASSDDSIEHVERLMHDHGIRHVPIQEAGRVVGIISERDLHRLVNPALPPVDKGRILARSVLLPDPYIVPVDAPLARVVSEMAARHIGSAIVVKNGRLAGILSVTDVCRVLGEVLNELFPTDEGNDAA